jgi:hypothetical protein
MKSMAPSLALAIALLCVTGAHAQDTQKVTVIRDYTDSVAPAEQQAYEAGTKLYNQCLGQHGFKYAWIAWSHETGDTFSYSYISEALPWEAFDAMHTAGKACDQALRTNVNPHLKSETSAFIETQPELTHMPKGAGLKAPFIEITYFKLKPGHEASEAFKAAVKKITDAANKTNWPEHYSFGRVRGGGEGSPDYIFVSPSKSWGEIGEEANPTLWKMVENVYGKDDAQATRKSINDAIESTSTHIDSYNADLTYTPSGK